MPCSAGKVDLDRKSASGGAGSQVLQVQRLAVKPSHQIWVYHLGQMSIRSCFLYLTSLLIKFLLARPHLHSDLPVPDLFPSNLCH